MPTLADLLRSFVNSPLSSPLSFSHSEPKKSKDKKTKNSQNQNSKLASSQDSKENQPKSRSSIRA
ncbi:hypothetical protein BCR33DRAFT_730877, partial [Rhizoclosmatium globosum]